MPADAGRDLGCRDFRLMPARDLAPFIEVQMQIGLGDRQRSLRQPPDFVSKSQFQLESTASPVSVEGVRIKSINEK